MTDEEGGGTVLATGIIAVLAVIMVALIALASAVDAAHRAAASADFAALAGAQVLADPHSRQDPCRAAAATVGDVTLVSCTVSGSRVSVETAAEVPFVLGSSLTLRGRASAGPADN